MKTQVISLDEISKLWEFTPSIDFRNHFEEYNFEFESLSCSEKEYAILEILKALESDLVMAGPNRREAWEKGWDQNLAAYSETKDLQSVVPKYFGKYPYLRWKQEFIRPKSIDMESQLLSLIVHQLMDKYLGNSGCLYEFGCGTGSNLVGIRKYHPNAELVGLDWASSSQKLIKKIAKETNDSKLRAFNFDYFNPDYNIKINHTDAVLTVASLEQTGSNFKTFVEYLLNSKPQIVIHIEPMWEPLDEKNLLDYLSINYFKKRNYLDGLLSHIKELETAGKARIIESRRSQIGSFFIDGYSILVWEPI